MDTVSTHDGYGLRHLIAAGVVGIVIGAAVAKLLPVVGVYTSWEECVAWELSSAPKENAVEEMLKCSDRFGPKMPPLPAPLK